VYSIWICRNVPKELENTITSYDLTEINHVGSASEHQENYDLMSVVMVCLGHAKNEQQSDLLKMLNMLLSEEVRASEKLEILSDEFRVPATECLEEEVLNMCNLSQGIEEKGIEKGIEKGKIETAKKFLSMGLPIGQVVEGTGLSLDVIQNLSEN